MSKKKNRGKQRKKAAAAAATAPAAGNGSSSSLPMSLDAIAHMTVYQSDNATVNPQFQHYMYRSLSISPSVVASHVRRGLDVPTQALNLLDTQTNDVHRAYVERVVDEGVIPTVLGFLANCEDSTFPEVLAGIGEGSNLACPSTWVHLLQTTAAEKSMDDSRSKEARLQIAKSIDPLIRCMCDTTKREFFRSNLWWKSSVMLFVNLVDDLSLTEETIPILLGHSCLRELVTRCLFWRATRPDLAELLSEKMTYIVESAGRALRRFILSSPDADRVRIIGGTPITNEHGEEVYSFIMGLIDQVKARDDGIVDKAGYFLSKLVRGNCVDGDVISSFVECGVQLASNYDEAKYVLGTMHNMVRLCSTEPPKPVDARFAAAVNAGMIEACLEVLNRYKVVDNDEVLSRRVLGIVEDLASVASLRNTSKAIARRSGRIGQVLERVEELGNCASGDIRDDITRMIKSTIEVVSTGKEYKAKTFCRKCMKMLPKSEVKMCQRCKRAVYCSRACQVDDWKSCHKKECKIMKTTEEVCKEYGASASDIKTMKKQDKNVSVWGNKLFTDNIPNVCMQAVFLGHNLIDCVVIIDMRVSPITINIRLAKEWVSELMDVKENQGGTSNTNQLIDRNRRNEDISCIVWYKPAWGPAGTDNYIFKTFYKQSAGGSWVDYQRQHRAPLVRIMEERPELREAFQTMLENGEWARVLEMILPKRR